MRRQWLPNAIIGRRSLCEAVVTKLVEAVILTSELRASINVFHERPMKLRKLGNSDIEVSPIAMGCWPIAGMTSLNVNDDDSRETLRAALAAGINFFDTAYAYGRAGESERLLAEVFSSCRDDIVLATKCGLGWDEQGQRVLDGRPETLRKHLDESLRRLNTDQVELLYLHAPDPAVPVSESAGALREAHAAGKTRLVGVSNFSVDQLESFHKVCPIAVVQPPYNMLQREIETDLIPWCHERGVSVAVYWPLLKGLLAGKLPRDHVFLPGDGRAKYPMFQGVEWQRNQDFVDELRAIATDHQATVAQLATRWTIEQPGITAALCGAKRAWQIEEVAAAMQIDYSETLKSKLSTAIARRGAPSSQAAV